MMEDTIISLDKLNTNLPSIIEGINTEDNVEKLKTSVVYIRKALSVESNPPIDFIIRMGFVPTLIRLLHHFDPTIQEEAAWALTNIASGSQDHTLNVVNHGIIPCLGSILNSPHQKICDQAVWGLGNIAGDSVALRNLVLQNGILTTLLGLFQKYPNNSSILRNSSWALSNLFRGKPLSQDKYVEEALPSLIRLIHTKDSEALSDALWCLSYVSDTSNEKMQLVLDHNIVPRLIEILNEGIKSQVSPALRTIGNFLTGDDIQTQSVLNAGTLGILEKMLQEPRVGIRKEVCWCFSNITSGNRQQIQQVIDCGVIPQIIKRATTDELQVKKEAVWVISNACCGASPEQIKYLVDCDSVSALIHGVRMSTDMTKVALEGLNFIAKAGFNEMNPNLYIDKFSKFKVKCRDHVGIHHSFYAEILLHLGKSDDESSDEEEVDSENSLVEYEESDSSIDNLVALTMNDNDDVDEDEDEEEEDNE